MVHYGGRGTAAAAVSGLISYFSFFLLFCVSPPCERGDMRNEPQT